MAAAFAAPMLMQQFGEKDAAGSFVGVKYWPPAAPEGTQGTPWTASVGPMELNEANDDGTGTHREAELREVVTLQGATPATPFRRNGLFEIERYPGERFSIESINAGAALTSVRVYRYATEKLQRRGVERGR